MTTSSARDIPLPGAEIAQSVTVSTASARSPLSGAAAASSSQPLTLQETLAELSRTLQSLRPASNSPMARPTSYSGNEECSGFLLQSRLYMEIHAQQFTSDRAKIAFMISLLTGRALSWAQALWNSNAPALQSLNCFIEHFQVVFAQTSNAVSVHDQLLRLRQNRSTVSDYALQFRTIAANSGWNEVALMTAYRRGLNPDICLQLAIYEDSIGIEKLIQRSIMIAQNRTACLRSSTPFPPRSSAGSGPRLFTEFPSTQSPSANFSSPEPMDISAGHLTTAERTRRRNSNLCLYCGAADHYRLDCPIRPRRSAV